jgi:23S rRNA (uridine2552-2'-O)-methyltransferase
MLYKKNNKNIYDYFSYKARQQGFVARSIFKLQEINSNFSIIAKDDVVLDLGCAPGSWIQYVEKIITYGYGKLVAIDLLPIKILLGSKTIFLQKNIFKLNSEEIQKILINFGSNRISSFNVILSDMADNITGIKDVDQYNNMRICFKVLSLSNSLLKVGGHMCVKIFACNMLNKFINICKKYFVYIKLKRTKCTRSRSREFYLIAMEKKDNENYLDDNFINYFYTK